MNSRKFLAEVKRRNNRGRDGCGRHASVPAIRSVVPEIDYASVAVNLKNSVAELKWEGQAWLELAKK